MAYPGADNLGVYPVPPPGPDTPPGGIPDSAPSADLPPGGVPDEPQVTPDSLRASYRSVQDANPDEHGKVIRLSRETGIPAPIVAADPAGIERARLPAQLELLPAHAPALAQHVADPANMAAAKDDTGSLFSLEWSLTNGRQLGVFEAFSEAFKTAAAQIRIGFSKTRDRFGVSPAVSRAIFGVDLEALAEAARNEDPLRSALGTGSIPTAEEVAAHRQMRDSVRAAEEVHAKGIIARAWTGTAAAGPFLLGNIAAGQAGGILGAFGFNFGAVYGETLEQLEQVQGPEGKKLSPGMAKGLGVGIATGEAAIYSVGLGRFAGRLVKPVVERIPGEILTKSLASTTLPAMLGRFALRFGIAEAEGAATLAAASALESAGVEIARTQVDSSHEFDTTAVTDRAAEAFEQALVDFALLSAVGAGRALVHDIGISRTSAREAQALQAAAQAVKESKLADRDPSAVEALIDQASPGQTVLVSREAWDQHFGRKARDRAIEVVGDEGRVYDAATDFIPLPLNRTLVRLGKTDAMAALVPDMKFTPEARTYREEAKFQVEQAQRDEEARKARGAQLEEEKAKVAKVVRDQAVEAGVAAEEAAAVGTLVAESAGAVSIRTGLPVDEATVLMGLGRFRFLGPKATEVAQAAHEKLMADLSPAAREEIQAARRGDRRAQQRLEAAAYVDPLTGTLNQGAFLDYTRTRREGWDVSIDVNNQNVQDLIGGHAVGDQMLRNVAQAMREAHEATGGVGSLYRRGGDEFHAGGFKSQAEAEKFAQALSRKMKGQPEVAKGFKVSVSIGVGPDVLAADRAAYLAKEKKTAEFGTYAKGQQLAPEALAKLGQAESFVEVRTERGTPRGETPVTQIGANPVTVKLEQAGEAQPRGLVRMQIDALGKPIDFPVQILQGDASTAFHELGHFLSWAMHDVAADPRGTATRRDYEALLKWAGYSSAEERLHANLERSQIEGKAMPLPEEASRLKALRAKEERIGYGFERYLAEGVAPSRALERVFARLREWMTRVYRGLFAISEQYRQHYGQDLQVSDEIRGVFDRWLSAEQAVRRAEMEAGISEATGALLGALDPKDREILLRANEDARVEATTKTYQTLKQDEQGPRESVRKKLREEIAQEVADEPVRKLETYLTSDKRPEAGILSVATGRLDPSLLDEHGKPFRLDRKTIVEDYGEGIAKELPRGSTVAKGGVDADFLAERFGFESGDAMIQALRSMGDRESTINARLEERIRELYPAVIDNPAAVVEAAINAEHSPRAAEAALEAARILVREVDPALGLRLQVMSDPALRKSTAERLISETRVGDAQPERFLAAERKYAREALELTAKALGKNETKAKDYAAQAMDAREKQLLNMEMYRQARDVRAEAGKAQRYLGSFTTPEKRKELGRATSSEADEAGRVWVTQPYLDRMDELLESIDFRKGAGRAKRAEQFAEWLEKQPADARDDIMSRLSPSLLRNLDRTRHFTDLTVQEMRDLVAAAETIEAQAKLKSRLRTAQGERDKERFITQVVEEIGKRFPQGGGVARFPRAQSVGRRALEAARKGKATLAPPEELYRELGPTFSQVFQTLSDAEVQASRLMREVGGPIIQQIESLSRKERKLLRATFEVDGEKFTGESIIAIALNWGNESNRSKLLRGEKRLSGEQYKLVRPISEETFRKAMSHLSPKGVELVNTILRQVGEAKWNEIAALEKEFTGLAPPKIEASPYEVTLQDGTKAKVSGGYYPAAYDPRFSDAGKRAGEQVSQGVGALAFTGSYERATTPQGHLQARVESYARPIDLSLSALPRAIVNHMRDLAMRRALVQTREILTDSRVRDAIQEAMGVDAYDVLTQHWRDTANEFAGPRGQADYLLRWSQRRRAAVTGAVFAGNVAQAIQNFANVGPALDALPAPLLAKAFKRFSVERMEMADRIFAESPYMAERFQKPGTKGAIQRAAADLAGRQGPIARTSEKIRDAGMWFMETTDLVTALPVYEAAKELAMRPKGEGVRGMREAGSRATGLGMSEKEAIAFAEQTVRLTQSSYRWMDRSAFARHDVLKHFTMFWGYMNAQLGRFVAAHADRRLLADEGFKREALRRVVKSYAFLMASGVMADLLVGKGPEDYDGDGEVTESDWGQWIGLRAVLYPPSTLPIVGSYIGQIGGPGVTRDPSLLPAQRVAQVTVKALEHAHKAMSPEAQSDEAWKAGLSALEAFGWYYGLPVVQTRRTGDYWFDIAPDGPQLSEKAQDALGPQVFGTVYGPANPGRLGQAVFGGQ